LVHLLEQPSAESNCHVVKCGSSHYTGAQSCGCKGGGNRSRRESYVSDEALTQYLSELYIGTPAAMFAQPEAGREGYANAYQAAYGEPAQGYYQANAYGLPVNTADGYVDMERRSVHMANLSRKTREKDIERLLKRKKIGSPLTVDLHMEPKSERCKGSAVVHFATADEANRAVGMLADYIWNDRKIRVRLAKEAAAVPVHLPGPVIVNGTTAY
jgi:hypothetical protein